jgi:uncharacterized protein DUF6777
MTTSDPRTLHSTHPNYVGQQFQAPQYGAPQYGAPQYGAPQDGAQGFAGQQFPGPVPPPGSPPSRKRPLVGKLIAGLVAAGLVVGGAGTWMTLSGSSAEAALQTTSFAGANPTTNPFGTDNPQVAKVAATGPQAGDTPGMFAATTPPSCDNAAFLSQLQADPAKLAAFGGVFGIGAGDVPAFVNSLSPVVLRAASSVTDHPFTNGAFVGQPAVLAAGTAVLVNSYGEPTVKCFNGNPLTAGASTAGAVTITPTNQVIAQFRFTSVDNTRVVVIPGKPDPKPNPGPNPSPGTPGTQPGGTVLRPKAGECDPIACRDVPKPGTGDPVLNAKAADAAAQAAGARKDATEARAKADNLKSNAQFLANAATAAENQLQLQGRAFTQAGRDLTAARAANDAAQAALANDALNPVLQRNADAANTALVNAFGGFKAALDNAQRAKTDRDGAKEQAEAAAGQFTNADAAATSAEGVATAVDTIAKTAKEKADKARTDNPTTATDTQTDTGKAATAPTPGTGQDPAATTPTTGATGADTGAGTTGTGTTGTGTTGTTSTTGTTGTGTTGTTGTGAGTTGTGTTGGGSDTGGGVTGH